MAVVLLNNCCLVAEKYGSTGFSIQELGTEGWSREEGRGPGSRSGWLQLVELSADLLDLAPKSSLGQHLVSPLISSNGPLSVLPSS